MLNLKSLGERYSQSSFIQRNILSIPITLDAKHTYANAHRINFKELQAHLKCSALGRKWFISW